MNSSAKILIGSLLVLLSRIPFLDAGFGVEEDSWGIAVAAHNSKLTGIFEASRLPGHPFNEMFYVLMWGLSSWWYNLSSALMSVLLYFFSYKSLEALRFKAPMPVAMAIVFVPVIYINSTCTVEYLWSVAFITGAFYFFLKQNWKLGILFFSMSVGCRLTNVVFVLPFLYFFKEQILDFPWAKRVQLLLLFSLLCLLWYSPVIAVYGPGFFTYSDQFPYPSIPKVIYKATFGVWGVLGLMGILFFLVVLVKKGFKSVFEWPIVRMTLIVCLLFTLLYIMLPQKSAYWIPVIPFVFFTMSSILPERILKRLMFIFLISPFFCGINLTDAYRGSDYSALAVSTVVKGQEIFFDPLNGLMQNDYSKRKRKLEYGKKVMDFLKKQSGPVMVICGWWYNQLLITNFDQKLPKSVELKFYVDEPEMLRYKSLGATIYYLEEQDLYNDLNSGIRSTNSFATGIKF